MISKEIAGRLGKLLRLLTSPYDGEVVATANRLNALVIAHDIDWDQVLNAATVDLTRAQMEELYQAGYRRGLEEASAAPRRDDWANAGTSRTDEIGNRYREVMALLEAASKAAAEQKLGRFEIDFTISMIERLDDWKERAFISARQWEVLDRLRNKLEREGYL